jgi:hypothetical protein
MAYPTGIVFQPKSEVMGLQPIGETSTTKNHPLGMVIKAFDHTYGEGEFIYLKGVASTAAGDLVCYDTANGATVRAKAATAGSNGPAAVAMSANVASQYGWYQIGGSGPIKAATVLGNAAAYLTSTDGQIDDSVVAGDKVEGMATRSTTAAGFATVQLDRPSITGESVTTSVGTLTTDMTAVQGRATVLEAFRKITLSAAAEVADVITVSGVVENLVGVDLAVATQVLVRTLPVTDNEGDIAVTVGTAKRLINPATGWNEAWIETTAAGLFTFTVTNAATEETLVVVVGANGYTATLKLTFAA